MGKWVSVEDRLPANGFYLCSGHGGYKMLCFRRKNEWLRSPQLKRVDGVTHWMEIPPILGGQNG